LPWYGNVRELANSVARAIALGDTHSPEALEVEWPALIGRYDPELLALPFARARDQVLADFERQYVENSLARHAGSVTRAAQGAGISRRYFTTLATRQRR
jgi:DNA-binding NtrC family response regulator